MILPSLVQPTFDSTMASDTSASSSASRYPPNSSASRVFGNIGMTISASSLYDEQKQVDRVAMLQAFADQATVELLQKMADSCKERRRKGGALVCTIRFQVSLFGVAH